jgi:D-sedoheptulose 7-phosphate isomerase
VADACADAITVDTPATSTVQEVHLAAIHIMCAAVDAAVRDGIAAVLETAR